MKKAIKNYLAKLHDNKKKGFSLVELIIVIAIMAILVGVVASQVIPYMEKSRQAKDQQQLSNVSTALVSAISQSPIEVGDVTSAIKLENVSNTFGRSDSKNTDVGDNLADLLKSGSKQADLGNIVNEIKGKFKSKAATGSDTDGIYVKYVSGVVTVYAGKSNGAASAKLEVESE